MANAFRYVFDDNLYSPGYWERMPLENGKIVYRILYPEHSDQFGEFMEVIETGDHQSPYVQRTSNEYRQFYSTVLKWFSDYKLLSG